MKTLNIFKPGKHTASNGSIIGFSEENVRAIVDNYDPAVHEAPITVGHPKDNLPAYGWIQDLSFSEDTGIEAIPHQVNADFEEMVGNHAFKKISASFYTPEAPNNPAPGDYYLRHVAFLGAQPPAVKGLRDAEFNEAEEGVVEFMGAFEESTIASLFRRLREWIISEKGIEEADKVIPNFSVEELEAGARAAFEHPSGDEPAASFSETGDDTMNEAELKAAQAKLAADQAEFKENQTKLATEQSELDTRRNALDKEDRDRTAARNAEFCDALIKEGKMLPAQKDGMLNFMAQLDSGMEVSFGEGDKAVKSTGIKWLQDYMTAQPKLVDFGEHSNEHKGDGATDTTNAKAVATAINMKIKTHKDETGEDISYAEAATMIQAEASTD